MKHSFKDWLIATRPWSFPVSTMPVLVTAAYLMWKDASLNWCAIVLSLLGMVLFHAAGNVLSDWWDYRKGVDTENAYAVPNLVFHHFEPGEYLRLSAVLFALGCATGLILCVLTGWNLLFIGLIGLALAASYSFFKFNALGDIFVFTCFSILPMIGTSLAASGSIDWSTVWVAVPLGIITVAVLHDNNTVDIATDSEAGIHTVPMILGEKFSAGLYIAYLILPYLFVIIACAFHKLPWLALICFVSAPLAYGNAKAAFAYFSKGREALLGLDQKTAKLHMVFSLTFAAGLLIASFA